MEVIDTAKSAFDLSSYPRRDLAFGTFERADDSALMNFLAH